MKKRKVTRVCFTLEDDKPTVNFWGKGFQKKVLKGSVAQQFINEFLVLIAQEKDQGNVCTTAIPRFPEQSQAIQRPGGACS